MISSGTVMNLARFWKHTKIIKQERNLLVQTSEQKLLLPNQSAISSDG
jgi:protein associated with RNAse G/E